MKRLGLGLTALMITLLTSLPLAAEAMPVRWTASNSAQPLVSDQPTKKEIMARLKTLQDQQIASSNEIDAAIRKQLQETLTMEIKNDELPIASRRTGLVTKKIEELNKRRNELNARREIFDRLMFQVDSKWTGQKLQTFLEQTFIEMASVDLADGRDSRLWKAFTYFSMVVREVPEKNEDVLNIFEGYLNYSSVLDPKTPADYLASRNYTNGTESVVAHPVAKDEVGDLGPNITGPVIEMRTSLASQKVEAAKSPEVAKADALKQAVAKQTETPKTTIVLAPGPAPTATAPPTPIKAARDRERTNPPNTMSGTSQSARDLAAPASEAQLH